MSRWSHRFWLEGTLVATSAFHVGSGSPTLASDAGVLRDATGDPIVPGTTLAGAVRALAGSDEAHLWGAVDRASHVTVADALVAIPRGLGTSVRDGVGIDRRTGTAAPAIKFDRELVPPGATVPLRMRVDVAGDDAVAQAEVLLWRIAELLRLRGLDLGRGRSVGLGRFEARELVVLKRRIDRADDLLAALRGDRLPSSARVEVAPPQELTLSLDFRTDLPLRSGGRRSSIAELVPMVTVHPADPSRVECLIPGSSIKGRLRSHAERLVRTALGREAEACEQPEDFTEQMRLPLVDRLFGRSPSDDDDGRRGALEVGECRSTNAHLTRHDGERPEEVLETHGDVGLLLEQLRREGTGQRAAGLAAPRRVHHVTIDRWSGAASDGALFDELLFDGLEWEPLELRVDAKLLGEDPAPLALLALVLADLRGGLLSFGAATRRGLGHVVVTELRAEGEVAGIPGGILAEMTDYLSGARDDVPAGTEALVAAWSKALASAEDGPR